MKNLSIFLALVILSTGVALSQTQVDVLYLKNGSIIRGQVVEMSNANVKIRTADGSLFVFAMSDVEKMIKEDAEGRAVAKTPERTGARKAEAPSVVKKTVPGTFSMRGGIFIGLQSWSKLGQGSAYGTLEPDSKIGFGVNGTIAGGVDLEDGFWVGGGPHLGGNFWTKSAKVGGYTARSTINVLDYGLDGVFGMDDMFLVLGFGGSGVSVTASVGGDSKTVDMPEDASYFRFGAGWADGFGFGIFYVAYSEPYSNLSRLELNLGWSF